MALKWGDRIAETSTTTGTGAFTLAAAITGYQRFSAVCSVSDTIYYAIFAVDALNVPSGDWEAGLGTYSSANTLTRTSVLSSSNGGAAVDFAAGTKWVIASPVAAIQPTAFALTLLDDADASAARSTLGLGTAATLSTSDVDERARDAVGTALVAGNLIDITVNDGSDTITIDVDLTEAAANDIKPTESLIIACSDESTAITTGTAKATFRMPYAFTLTDVRASVNTAPTGSTIVIDINEGGSSILSTKLSIDASEKTSTTAATAAVISDSSLADDAEITIDFDQVGSTIAGKGVKVVLIGHR